MSKSVLKLISLLLLVTWGTNFLVPVWAMSNSLAFAKCAPGLEVKLPAGLKMTRFDGTPVTEITITTVRPDRSPMPYPVAIAPVQLLSIQPADAILSEPVQITYPNLSKKTRPHDQVDLYRADHETESGDYIYYGTGRVSEDGRQVLPELDPATGKPYGLPAFSWHFPIPQPQNPGPGDPDPKPHCPCEDGIAPGSSGVDLASGTERMTVTDIGVSGGRMPFNLTRVYRSDSIRQGPFGIGAAHNFELIVQEFTPQYVELVQANNARTKFAIAEGQTAQFINSDDPEYRGAILTKTSSAYSLRLKNGESMEFSLSSFINGKNNYFLTKITDRNGNTMQISRDAGKNITQINSSSGYLNFIVDNTTGRIQKVVDQGGRSVSYEYDNLGRLIKVSDPLNQSTRYSYDDRNQLLATTNARGILEVQRNYDVNGRILEEQMPNGGILKFVYTPVNPSDSNSILSSLKTIDKNNNSEVFRIGEGLYIDGVEDSSGQSSLVARLTGSNRIERVVDRLGRVMTPVYDSNENLRETSLPDGSVIKAIYEPTFNQVITDLDALGKAQMREYDTRGNLVKTTNPLGKSTIMTYDNQGQMKTFSNPLSQTSSMIYDSRGNLIQTIDWSGRSTQMEYDIWNRLSKVINSSNQSILYQHDLLDRLVQVTSAEGRAVKMFYDPNGNLTSLIDPKGNTTKYHYNDSDQRITVIDPSNKTTNYAYGPNGNLISIVDRKGQQISYTYDTKDRLLTTSYADGWVVTNTYGTNGRLLSVNDTAPGAGLHTFKYDLMDRVIQETSPRGTVSYSYDLLGRQTNTIVNNGRTIRYGYDPNDRMVSISEGSDVYTFSYDDGDRRQGMTLPNGVSALYTYDASGQLAAIQYQNGNTVLQNLTYGYNQLGQLASSTGNLVPAPKDSVITTTGTNNLNQYTNVNGQAQTFDENGNQKQGSFTTTWDARNQLTSLSKAGFTASFTYDAFGRRTSKTINGRTSTYLYDGADIIKESSIGDTQYLYGVSIDEPLMRRGGTTEYYHADISGSIIALTDRSGTIKTGYNYSPFGLKSSVGRVSDNPYGFTGREDDGTGLYYYRARYYDPAQKRFISQDPIGFSGGDTNLYSYVGNSPTNARDPSGNCAFAIPLVPLAWETVLGAAAALTGVLGMGYMASQEKMATPVAGNGSGSGDQKKRRSAVDNCDEDDCNRNTTGDIHHIATYTNNTVGGAYGPKFRKIFSQAGLDIQYGCENLVRVPGHVGPHSDNNQQYHEMVLDRLNKAIENREARSIKDAVSAELEKICIEILKPGSTLNELVTKTQPGGKRYKGGG